MLPQQTQSNNAATCKSNTVRHLICSAIHPWRINTCRQELYCLSYTMFRLLSAMERMLTPHAPGSSMSGLTCDGGDATMQVFITPVCIIIRGEIIQAAAAAAATYDCKPLHLPWPSEGWHDSRNKRKPSSHGRRGTGDHHTTVGLQAARPYTWYDSCCASRSAASPYDWGTRGHHSIGMGLSAWTGS